MGELIDVGIEIDQLPDPLPWPISFGSEGYDKAQSYLIKGLIPESASIGIYGPSGSFKSFLTLSWCCHIAAGKEWDGRKVNKGAVLYIAGEGGIGVARRIRAWEKKYNNAAPLNNLARIDNPIFPSDPMQAKGLVTICQEIEIFTGLPVKLIVFDTLARCFGGSDENSAKDMGSFIGGCDYIKAKTNASVIVVHHSGKDQEKGARGSSALRAALDVEMMIKRESDALAVEVSCTKMKDAEPADKRTFDLTDIEILTDEDGDKITSLSLTPEGREPTEENCTAPNMTKNHSALWQAIRSRVASGEPATRAIIRDDLAAQGFDRKKFSRWLTKLIKDGLVKEENDKLYAIDRSGDLSGY